MPSAERAKARGPSWLKWMFSHGRKRVLRDTKIEHISCFYIEINETPIYIYNINIYIYIQI